MRVQSADFERSFPRVVDCPEDDVPEIAFIGRSNVGKSSLLNLLVGNKKLARVSQTPGCTQLINFFRINRTFRFVDLPGYGFAKVPKGGRAFFQQLVADYMLQRPNLRRVFVLIDSRHEPQQIDIEFVTWLAETGRTFDLVFTKADKLKPAKLEGNIADFLEAIAPSCPECHRSSSQTGAGRNEILGRIGSLLRE